MDQQTQQQRTAPAPQTAPQAASRAASIPGPAHAPLATLSESLNDSARVHQLAAMVQPPARGMNRTGLPDALKAGVETLSGLSLDSVKVHYNSARPAQLQAHAFAQGSDIHVAPGQERHLPHEAWHVVQQAQGRVKPTVQLMTGAVNDDAGLEREAETMGAKAAQLMRADALFARSLSVESVRRRAERTATIQRMVFGPPAGLALDPASTQKLNAVIAALTPVVAPDGPGTVTIRIINEKGLTPADTSALGNNILVRLNRWYLEKASVGDVVGMLTHELGVHTIADRRMALLPGGPMQDALEAEEDDQVNVHAMGPHVIGAYGPGAEPNRQQDHVNLAKSLAGAVSIRARMYEQVFLGAGDGIVAAGGTPAVVNAKLFDLAQSYLFDIARIVVTDDGGAGAVWMNAGAIAVLMNHFMGLLAPLAGAHPWLTPAFLARVETSGTVRSYLLGKVGQLLVSSHPQVQTARSVGVGALATGVALGVAGVALAPALALGVATGIAAWGIQKLLGI